MPGPSRRSTRAISSYWSCKRGERKGDSKRESNEGKQRGEAKRGCKRTGRSRGSMVWAWEWLAALIADIQ